MFYVLGEQLVGITPLSFSNSSNLPLPYYRWKVVVNNTKKFYIGSENCSILEGDFTDASIGGLQTGSLKYHTFDIPFWHRDKIDIYYNGKIKYTGFVDGVPDVQNDKVEISPYSKNLDATLYYHDYSSTSISYQSIIQDILTTKSTQLNINYNASFIDTGTTVLINPKYEYLTCKKILEDLNDQIDNRDSGIDYNNTWYIKAYSTNIDYYIYCDDKPFYEKLTYKIDDKKVKETRSQVFQKTTSNNSVRRGSVGYSTSSTSYQPLTIENRVGIKESKITAPQGLATSDCLDFAYKKLIAKTDVPENIKVDNVDMRRFEPETFKKVRIYKAEALIWHTIIDCETTSYWNNTFCSTNAKIGTYSLYFSGACQYNFPETAAYKRLKKIGFYIKSNIAGNILNVSFLQTASSSLEWGVGKWSASGWSNNPTLLQNNKIYIEVANQWQWVDYNVEFNSLHTISLYSIISSAVISLDEFKVLSYHRQYYDGNIIKIGYEIGSDFCDLEIGNFNQFLNDDFFRLEKKVQEMEETIEDYSTYIP